MCLSLKSLGSALSVYSITYIKIFQTPLVSMETVWWSRATTERKLVIIVDFLLISLNSFQNIDPIGHVH